MGNFTGSEKEKLNQILNYLTNNIYEILNKKESFIINFELVEVQNQEINPLKKILGLFSEKALPKVNQGRKITTTDMAKLALKK